MSLGKEVGLGPGHIVLDWDPAALPRKKGTQPLTNFRPMSVVAKRRRYKPIILIHVTLTEVFLQLSRDWLGNDGTGP